MIRSEETTERSLETVTTQSSRGRAHGADAEEIVEGVHTDSECRAVNLGGIIVKLSQLETTGIVIGYTLADCQT